MLRVGAAFDGAVTTDDEMTRGANAKRARQALLLAGTLAWMARSALASTPPGVVRLRILSIQAGGDSDRHDALGVSTKVTLRENI
jgi:hypothetical protein